jgi:type 1 fimbriae regulatory protein FimB/type 1 fimbriae regulatory protein FimE
MKTALRIVAPGNDFRSVPVRPANAELRSREYLTPAEIERLIKAARNGRWGHRDATLILIAYRRGLRASEICDLEWSQVEFGRSATLHVRRVKNGKPSAHPLRGDEIRALRELRRQFPDSGFVFATERGGPFTPDAVNRLTKRASAPVSPSRFTRTCSGTAAASLSPIRATIRAPSRIGSAIVRSNILSGTPSFHRLDSRISGADAIYI